MVGQTLGHYRIDARIGAGGMGEVYKATDRRLDRTVAVKVLPAHFADDLELKQRFEREAKTISSLNHPHICTLHDVGEHEGTNKVAAADTTPQIILVQNWVDELQRLVPTN